MTLHFLDIPDDVASLAKWLEDRISSDALGELVAELSSIHPEVDSRQESLESTIGSDLTSVLSNGLSALSESQLRALVRHPWLLLELQERVLIDGGAYWSDRSLTEFEKQSIQRVRTSVTSNIQLEPSSNKTRKTIAAKPMQLGSWFGTLVLAAATFLFGFFLQNRLPDPPIENAIAQTSCGWTQPDAFNQKLDRTEYLTKLADGAALWFESKPESAKELAMRIGEFRQGCSALLLAQHAPLPEADRDWILERCRAWAKKLDGHLLDLELNGDLDAVRNAVDATIKTLIEKLRERASNQV